MIDPFFGAHHSPVGAFATFTLGYPGASGGLGLERGAPPNEDVYIGAESQEAAGVYEALPFFDAAENEATRYDVEGSAGEALSGGALKAFPREAISRRLGLASDTWWAGDLTFRVYAPGAPVPDPAAGETEALRRAILPAVWAELTVDNRAGDRPRAVFFGYRGSDPYRAMRRIDETPGAPVGVGQGRETAIACGEADMVSGLGFTPEQVLEPLRPENRAFGLGPVGLLVGKVGAGERRTFRFAIGFYREGRVTTGRACRYYYTRFWDELEGVLAEALSLFAWAEAVACERDAMLEAAPLSEAQRFMLAHAAHSYDGSTELLEEAGRPLWVVNEGEYRMMNTFDLTVDMLFHEMRRHPWTVRNVLEQFLDRYRYEDQVRLPGAVETHPGGIAFTHDMGVANHFARPGHSAYEQAGLSGCFSHMTAEELVNWILTASVYVSESGDRAWAAEQAEVFEACLESLLRRDHPEPDRRNGIMGADSSRTAGGAEITTYDSLDTSLGQARGNLYLAVKSWAAALALREQLAALGLEAASAEAGRAAERTAATILAHVGEDGTLPAVFEPENPGFHSRIIPAVEGLLFPPRVGCPEAVRLDGPFGELIAALRNHLEAVRVPGVCLFEDGGWKISSTSDNTWLSKIYLCQYVARAILGLAPDPAADRVHAGWLTHPAYARWAWSDQIVSGRITASKYYPRGVTSVLWLDEARPSETGATGAAREP